MASRTELFLDDKFIEWITGASRKMNRPAKHMLNPVFKPLKSWEARCVLPNAVLYDREEKIFKMWYRTGPVDRKEEAVDGHISYSCYATSHDGINWERPELDLFQMGKLKGHNIVLKSEIQGKIGNVAAAQAKKAFILSVIKHPHPKDESEKYVAMFADLGQRGCYLARSADGIHWNRNNEPFWKTPVDVSTWGDDTVKSMIYDHLKKKWVIYRRVIPQESERLIAMPGDEKAKAPERITRVMGYADSSDLKNWENHKIIMMPDADDPPDTEFYGLSCYNYEQAYVGYLWIYHTAPDRDSIDVQLVSSRDGVSFNRCCRRETYLNSSPFGGVDYMISMGYMPEPMIVDDTVYLFYGASNMTHCWYLDEYQKKNYMQSICLARFPRDRFVSLEASAPVTAHLVTKPFILEHPYLHLNAETWDDGSIEVGILTRDWKEIQGFETENSLNIRGNALFHPVEWKDKNTLSSLVGKELRLKFRMRKSRIYALTFDTERRALKELNKSSFSAKALDTSPTGI